MISFYLFLVSVFVGCYGQQEQSSPLPVILSTPIFNSTEGCPTQEVREDHLDFIKNEIQERLFDTVRPYLDQDPCGAGNWTKIASFNITDHEEQCPTNWTLHNYNGLRGCSIPTRPCYSLLYPSDGLSYSHVCGRITAYQRGLTGGFRSGIKSGVGLEGAYIDGVSLTHGAPGNRVTFCLMPTSVLVPSLLHGLLLFLLSLVTITSAIVAITVPTFIFLCTIQMSLCLTERGVVLVLPVAS